MTFANVNIGSYAGDNTGDPLRTAFDKINRNFANITAGNVSVTLNAPVMSVAGRTGNIVLNINDVSGAVGLGRLNTTVNAANVAANAYTDAAISNLVNGAPLALDTLKELADLLSDDSDALSALTVIINQATNNQNAANVYIYDHETRIGNLESNSAVQGLELRTLTSNASVQSNLINTINANVVAVNLSIGALQTTASDHTNSISDLYANAATQSYNLFVLSGNAAMQHGYIGELRANITAANAVIAQHTASINSLLSNAAVQSDDLATLTANAAEQSSSITTLIANAATQSGTLTTLIANAAVQSNDLATLTANASSQATSIQTLLSNAISQAESLTSLVGNAVTQAEQIQSIEQDIVDINLEITNLWSNASTQNIEVVGLTANAAVQAIWLANLQSNAAQQDANISSLSANAATQSLEISALRANITAANTKITVNSNSIDSINTTVANLVTQLSTGPISITGNITAGNIITNHAVYFPDGSVQTSAAVTASTGNIIFTGDTIGSTSNGDRGITINASGYGEVVVSDNLGINNINPAYSLDIGNINENENSGAIGINFNNNVESVGHRYGSALVGWDWWDQNGHGTNNDGTEHYRFGIYNGNVAPFSHAWLSFDRDAPANSITVDNIGAVATKKLVTNTTKSNVQVRHTEVELNAPGSVEAIDVITGTQWIHTANTTQNFTFNIRGNSNTTLNDFLGIGETITVQYTVINSDPAYHCSGLQIDGVVQDVKWLQGIPPSSGTVNGYDLYNFFLTKTADNTYVILGQQQKYS